MVRLRCRRCRQYGHDVVPAALRVGVTQFDQFAAERAVEQQIAGQRAEFAEGPDAAEQPYTYSRTAPSSRKALAQ